MFRALPLLLAMLTLAAAPAFAQPAVSASGAAVPVAPPAASAPANGPERNHLDYQPTQGGVVGKEAAAGVRPPARVQKRTDAELNQIDRQLLQEEGKNPNNAVAPTPQQ